VADESATGGENPFVDVLIDFRKAAESHEPYDAYGYLESGFPASQRAALDGFCLVVNQVRDDSDAERLSDPAVLIDRTVQAAKPEAEGASPASIRRAVRQLETIVEAESLTPAVVDGYANGCY
jgi:hypothetical protein